MSVIEQVPVRTGGKVVEIIPVAKFDNIQEVCEAFTSEQITTMVNAQYKDEQMAKVRARYIKKYTKKVKLAWAASMLTEEDRIATQGIYRKYQEAVESKLPEVERLIASGVEPSAEIVATA